MTNKIPFEDYPILRRVDNGAEIKAWWRGGTCLTLPEFPSDRHVFGLEVEGDTELIVSEVDTHYLFIGYKGVFARRPAYELYGIARAGLAVCRETSLSRSTARITTVVDIFDKSCVYHEHWED